MLDAIFRPLIKTVIIGLGFLGLSLPALQQTPAIVEQTLHSNTATLIEQYVKKSIADGEILGAIVQPFAGATYTLAGSGVSSSATSLTLQSLTIPQTGQEIQDSDLSSTFYLTIEPGNRIKQEIISCTTLVQNAGGTATISGCSRGLSPITPFTASTTLQFAHAGGTQVIFSDPPQLFNLFAAKDNDETITHTWTFDADNPPAVDESGKTATSSLQLTTKAYVDNVTNQGAATSTETVGGILEMGSSRQAASSTDDGANRPYALTTKYSTAACTTATSSVLVSKTDGKLSNDCLDRSETLHWVGAMNLSSTTFSGIVNATTTVTHGTTTTHRFSMSTNPGDGKVLTSNSNGAGTWEIAPFSVASSTQSTQPSGTATSTRWRMQIPSGMWGANSAVELYINGNSHNGAAAQYLIVDIGINGGSSSSNHHFFELQNCDTYAATIVIGARGATNSQVYTGFGSQNNSGTCNFNKMANGLGVQFPTSSVDLSSGVVDVYVKARNTNSGDVFTIESIIGKFIP